MTPIRRVSVLSTGTSRSGRSTSSRTGHPYVVVEHLDEWTAPRPINVYVIEHDEGLVLFDTGRTARSVTDPDYFPNGLAGHIYARLAKFDVAPEETLTEGMRPGLHVDDVGTAVLSHLHQDHIGGLPELAATAAEIMASAADWAEYRPSAACSRAARAHIDLPGLRWTHVTPRPVDDPSIAPFAAAYDLFDDGSLVLVPTPGHTPGSLSLLLRQPGMPPMLFVGDLTYDVELLEEERIPGVGDHGPAESTRAVKALKRRHPASSDPGCARPGRGCHARARAGGEGDTVTPAELIRYLVLAAQREGNRQLGHALRALGLTPAQSEVLRILGEHEPLTLSGIGELLVCESGSKPEPPGRPAGLCRPRRARPSASGRPAPGGTHPDRGRPRARVGSPVRRRAPLRRHRLGLRRNRRRARGRVVAAAERRRAIRCRALRADPCERRTRQALERDGSDAGARARVDDVRTQRALELGSPRQVGAGA